MWTNVARGSAVIASQSPQLCVHVVRFLCKDYIVLKYSNYLGTPNVRTVIKIFAYLAKDHVSGLPIPFYTLFLLFPLFFRLLFARAYFQSSMLGKRGMRRGWDHIQSVIPYHFFFVTRGSLKAWLVLIVFYYLTCPTWIEGDEAVRVFWGWIRSFSGSRELASTGELLLASRLFGESPDLVNRPTSG